MYIFANLWKIKYDKEEVLSNMVTCIYGHHYKFSSLLSKFNIFPCPVWLMFVSSSEMLVTNSLLYFTHVIKLFCYYHILIVRIMGKKVLFFMAFRQFFNSIIGLKLQLVKGLNKTATLKLMLLCTCKKNAFD